MINQIAVNLPMFDAHQQMKEMEYLESMDVGLSTIFFHVTDMMLQSKGAVIQDIPAQYIREAIHTSKVIVANVEFHYWNNLSAEVNLSAQQYKEKILESVVHHARLLYIDLWGLVFQFGIPLQRIININRLPYGVFLDVTAA